MIIILCILLVVTILAIYNLHPLLDKFKALELLAQSQGNASDYYSKFAVLPHILYLLFPALVLLPLVTKQDSNKSSHDTLVGILKLIGMVLILCSGILAVLTPLPGHIDSNGSRIVTYQAQLPNGEMGYVVKAVSVTSDNIPNSIAPGIVPPVLDAKTSLVINGSYDYKLASLVVLRHYIPNHLAIVVLILLIVAFMLSIGQYLLALAKIMVFDVYAPMGWLKSYGDEGLLWLSRMSMVFIGGASIFLANFLVPYLLDFWFKAIILGLITGLTLLLFIVIMVYGKEK